MTEHAAELQLLDQGLELGGFFFDGLQTSVVAFFLAHLEQLGIVSQFCGELLQGQDDGVQRLLFLAQFLSLLGVVPDGRVFQCRVYGAQTFVLCIVVKDTSVTLGSGWTGLQELLRFD